MTMQNIENLSSLIGGLNNTQFEYPSGLDEESFNILYKKHFSEYDEFFGNNNDDYNEIDILLDNMELLPKYKLPSFVGPSGNIFFLMHSVKDFLNQNGFSTEAQIFINEISTANEYSEKNAHLVFLTKAAKYIDFGSPITWKDYQDINKFYLEKGINSSIPGLRFLSSDTVSQVPEYKKLNIEHLIKQDFNFNTLNCYGRNAIYYCTNNKTLKDVLEKTNANPFILDNFNKTIYNNLFDIIPLVSVPEGFKMLLTIHDKLFDKNSPEYSDKYSMQHLLINNFNLNKSLYLEMFTNFLFSHNDMDKKFLFLGTSNDKNSIYYNPVLNELTDIYKDISCKETKELLIDILDKTLIKFDVANLKNKSSLVEKFEESILNLEALYMKDFSSTNTNVKKVKIAKF